MVPEKGVQNRGGFSGPFDLVGRVGALHYARNTSQMGGGQTERGIPSQTSTTRPRNTAPQGGAR